MPGYVLIKMTMNEESWHAVRNITGVTGFVGPGSRPTPLSDDEVQNIVGALNLQKDKRLQSTGKEFTIYVHARRDANNEVYDHYSQYNDQNSTEKESGKTRCGITKIT